MAVSLALARWDWIAADIVRLQTGCSRALGRDSGRGHAGTVKERLAHVRRQVSAMTPGEYCNGRALRGDDNGKHESSASAKARADLKL